MICVLIDLKTTETLLRHLNLQLRIISFGKTTELRYTSTVNNLIGDIIVLINMDNKIAHM